MSNPVFIGKDALTHIAEEFAPQIIMGAAYYSPEEFDRLGIQVISGVQYKHTAVIMARKGGTTRRKTVGTPNVNSIGWLKERVLVAKLTWSQFVDNIDSYTETPYHADGSQDYSYPLSEVAFKAITATYGEDLFNNLFHGNLDNEVSKPELSLFNGFITCINQDINDGLISTAAGNAFTIGSLDAPTSETDATAWDSFVAWQQKWHAGLKAAQTKVLCSVATGIALMQAYENKHRSHRSVDSLPNGNFKVAEYPRVEFAPSDVFGEGSMLVATIANNLQYGVDTENAKNSVSVEVGGHEDHKKVSFQIESIQGARVLNPLASALCITTGTTLAEKIVCGDFKSCRLTITVTGGATMGSVTVNGEEYDPTKEYGPNESVVIKAVPASGKTFKAWADSATATAERTIVMNGLTDSAYTVSFQ